MLTREQNAKLTQVGPGTPLGRFLRHYWIPAANLEEIAVPGGAPVRVGLLGEKLVAFRDPSGKAGLVDEFCPHRRASLAYARNEVGGLRCLYHGWKMTQEGRVCETPPEPPTSKLKDNLKHRSYPVREAGGILWAYLGDADKEPPFPKFPWLDLPASQVLPVKMYQDSNFLQGLEGDLDPAHPNYLHKDFEVDASKSWSGAGWESIAHLMNDGSPEIICEETPYLMRVGAIRKTAESGQNYVRTTEWIAPFYCYIATGPHESQLFKAWLPIDDFSCFTYYIHFNPNQPLDIPAIHANWGHKTEPGTYRTPHNVGNMHLQDRQRMISGNFSGVEGAAIQDRAMQEGMGAICDRTQEHLGTSDKAVIFYRRLILRKLEEMDAGKPLPGLDPTLDFRHRTASWYMPSDESWRDVLRYQEEFERKNPVGEAA